MFIQSPNFNRNYLLIKKDVLQLSDLQSKQYNLLPITPNPKLALSTNFFSKNNQITEAEKENNRFSKNRSNYDTHTNSTLQTIISKYCPNLKEYKKRLYLKNVLSSEKNYLLEDYMKKKELKLINDKNKKTIYEARKIFFNDDKIDDNRTSFYYKEKSFDKSNKYNLMVKDIQSNYILLKNKNRKKNKEYKLLQKLESERKTFKDFNKKFGVRNVYITTDKILNKNKTFLNKNCNFFIGMNYLNSFRSTKTPLSQRRKIFSIK